MDRQAPEISDARRMFYAAVPGLLLITLMALVFLLQQVYHWDLHRLGIMPRTVHGLLGIITSPLVHGDLEHLFGNVAALLVLGWCLMYFYPRAALRVVVGIWSLGGALVWISGRSSFHIGASGLVYGLAFFLFFSGVWRRQRTLMALSMLIVFLYGSLPWGMVPLVARISWESHLAGGLLGLVFSWLFREVKPSHLVEPKEIVWEEEEEAVAPPEVIYHEVPDPNTPVEGTAVRADGTPLDRGATNSTFPL